MPRLLLIAALPIAAAAPSDQGRVGYATDGDTLRLTSGECIRIAGIDAPETPADQARGEVEPALGNAATARARASLGTQTDAIERVARSDNRTVARVTLHGRDLATTRVAEGAPRWWPRYAPEPDWCGSDAGGSWGRRRWLGR